ncbi:MAG TPA: GNAT family N-acetyltransferase [Ilumatobacteraceae bacterium]|nr:GNAT family N-acetyltransferase [Ilumatobacteraceae bacterium]
MTDPADVRIRTATAADEDGVVDCVNAAYEQHVAAIGKRPAPMLADYFRLIGDGFVRVAVAGEAIVGVIVMWPEADHLYVDNVAVSPAAQGTGLGKVLLADADDEARRLGFDEIRLYTNEQMTANLAYYPRRGYIETHRAEAEGYRRVYFTRQVR